MKRKLFLIITIVGLSSLTAQSYEVKTCDGQISKLSQLIKEDGTADNEELFLKTSEKTLNICIENSWDNSMKAFGLLGKENCERASEQGMSNLFKGHCFKKVAEAIAFIMAP